MGVRTKYIKDRTSRRLRSLNFTSLLFIGIMLCTVTYDAIRYHTPLYYMGFLFGGYLIGGVFKKTIDVRFEAESESFTISTDIAYIVLTILLLLIRFAIGHRLLEKLEVVYASDALCLIFIGIYYAKWRTVLKKIDALVYDYAAKRKAEKSEEH